MLRMWFLRRFRICVLIYCAFSLFLPLYLSQSYTFALYTLSLLDALPISRPHRPRPGRHGRDRDPGRHPVRPPSPHGRPPRMMQRRTLLKSLRSEEHTSELQSRGHLVCRLLLEKKKIQKFHGEELTSTIETTELM